MTTQPQSPHQPPPLPYQSRSNPPANDKRRFSLLEIISWVILIASVTYIAWHAARFQSQQAASNDPSIELPMQARYALGVHLLVKQSNPAQAAQTDAQTLASLEQNANDNPEDYLRIAILAGELQGTAEALTRLHSMEQSHPALAPDIHIAQALFAGQPVSQADHQRFHDKYQWFAELLDSHGKPNSDPQRAAIESRAYQTVFVLLGTFGAVVLLGIAGTVLLIIAIIRLVKGKIPRAFPRYDSLDGPPVNRAVYIAGMATYVGGYVALSLSLRPLLDHFAPGNDLLRTIVGIIALFFCFLAGFLLPLSLGESVPQWRATFGLTTGKGILREMLSGILGYLTGVPLIILGAILVIILSALTKIKGTHPIVQELSGSPWELLAAFLAACVFAPITEELMFRGALFAHLRERFNWAISAIVMGIIFALMHPQSWVALPVLASIAIVFAAIREWRGSAIGSITAHALHNGTALAVSLLLLR